MGIARDVRRRGIAVPRLVACPAISGIFLGFVAILCRYPSGGRNAFVLGAWVACAACAANALVIYLTVVVTSARPAISEDLSRALNCRVLIEQATGIVGEREGLNMEQASSKLRHHARYRRLRLVDVASDVIAGTHAALALDRPPPTTPSCGRHRPYEKRARRHHR